MTDEYVAYMGWGISAQEQIDGFRNEVRELKAENTRLRELCRDLRFCRGNDCLTCSHGRFCDLRLSERCDELGVVAE